MVNLTQPQEKFSKFLISRNVIITNTIIDHKTKIILGKIPSNKILLFNAISRTLKLA